MIISRARSCRLLPPYLFRRFFGKMGHMGKKMNKFIYWTPRILSILFICFLSIFSFDVISPELSFWQIVVGLFMHNIPVFVLLIILVISWKHEIVGGIGFISAGILYCGMIFVRMIGNPFEWYMAFYPLIIAGPALFVGILFLINWFRKKKNHLV